jgi:hypothetical protein
MRAEIEEFYCWLLAREQELDRQLSLEKPGPIRLLLKSDRAELRVISQKFRDTVIDRLGKESE